MSGRPKSPMWLKVWVILIITGAVADLLDCIFYFRFAARRDGDVLDVLVSYLCTPVGATLTTLGVAPLLFLIFLAWWCFR